MDFANNNTLILKLARYLFRQFSLNTSTNKILFFVAALCFLNSWSQTDLPPSITADGDQVYCPLSQINVVENFSITDPDDTTVDAFYIQISTGYVNGEDVLSLTGSHPTITTSWSTLEGKLTLEGIGGTQVSYVDMISAVNDVVFSSSNVNVQGEKFFSFTIGDANYLPSTGHFYQYVPNLGISWSNARNIAATYTYYGLQGYLATITSSEEAILSGEQAAGAGWIGGSDEQTEGVWKWMTGPEAGTIFWNGGINGSTPNYANWNTGEPNSAGNEDYTHVTAPGVGIDGSWNDLSNVGNSTGDYQPKGFIVEYGGMPGDPVLNLSASTKISVLTIDDTLGDENCGPSILTLEATPSQGTVLWFHSATGGTQVGSGTTFTTPLLNSTTTFYALPSINGCSEGIRTSVVAIIKEIPTIISFTDDDICINTQGTITATPSQGTVTWYDSAMGGTQVGTGTTLNSSVLTSTTSYYAEPELNGCIGPRQAVTITVQDTAAPMGNSTQTFCDIDNATIADLSVSGSGIKWYLLDTGGTELSSTDVLVSGTYFASQTIANCESAIRFPVDVIVYGTVVLPSSIPDFMQCDDNSDGSDTNGISQFDLTQNETIILNGANASDFTFHYFTDAAYSNEIFNPNTFNNTVQGDETIYVRIENNLSINCFTETSFNLKVLSLPEINSPILFKNCDEDGIPDGFTDYNLTEINDLIVVGSATDLNISYHLSSAEAQDETNAVNEVPFNNSTSNLLYARVENTDGCYRIATVNLQVSTTSFPSGYVQEIAHCDEDDNPDGYYVFDLTQVSQNFLDEFPLGQNLTVHYYTNLEDAQLEQNEISNPTNYINEVPFYQELYVRVESEDNGDCFGIGPHLTLTVNERPEFEVDQSDVFCLNGEPITLDVYNPSGFYTYQWTDQTGQVVSTGQSAEILVGGNYTVVASSLSGCESFPYTFNVVESSIADIGLDDITIVDFSNNNTITINNSNNNLGIGDYEFALDNFNGFYQDEPYFNYVGAGDHVLYVRDKNGCGVAEMDIFILGFPKYFTPNGDPYNQYWNLKGWNTDYSLNSKIHIFDRYGKLLYSFGPWTEGWDGTFKGNPLMASDYWFVAELVKADGTIRHMQGHFSLVR